MFIFFGCKATFNTIGISISMRRDNVLFIILHTLYCHCDRGSDRGYFTRLYVSSIVSYAPSIHIFRSYRISWGWHGWQWHRGSEFRQANYIRKFENVDTKNGIVQINLWKRFCSEIERKKTGSFRLTTGLLTPFSFARMGNNEFALLLMGRIYKI